MHPDKRRKGREIRKRNRGILRQWNEISRAANNASLVMSDMAESFLAVIASAARAIELEKEKANDRSL